MKIISYSQNFEDVMLWRALKHIENGFYIDVGAAWPINDSVTKLFYDAGWRGINIEPNLTFYSQYEVQRPEDVNLNIAISDNKGTAMMNFIKDTGLSTLNSEVMKIHSDKGFHNDMKEVEVLTLNNIFELYIPANTDVHFLKIDVEGFENEVIRGCDWTIHRPWILVIEATVPMSQKKNYDIWESVILNAGYDFVYNDGLNRFYLAHEHSELKKAFANPPNVFDSFILYSEHCKNETIKTLTEKTEQKNDEIKSLINKVYQISDEKSDIEHNVKLLTKKVDDFFHANWYLRNQLLIVKNSKSWRITRPLRMLRRLFIFIKNFDKRESPKSLIRFLIAQLNKFPKIKSLIKSTLIRVGLKDYAAKIIYNSVSMTTISKTESLTDQAIIIKTRIESARVSLTASKEDT